MVNFLKHDEKNSSSIPIKFVTRNPITTYNVMFFIIYALAGSSAYTLVNYLTKHKFIAFIAGFAFAFSPYMSGHAYSGHFNLMNIWILPLFVYFLLQLFEKKKNAHLFLALIITLQGYIDFHYILYMQYSILNGLTEQSY